jgi:hypothetical protein
MCIKVWGVGLPPLRRPSLFWGLPPPRPPGWGGCRRPKAPAAAPPTGVGAPQHKAEDLRDGSPPDSVGTVWAPIKIYIYLVSFRGVQNPLKTPLLGARNRPLRPRNEVPEPSRTIPGSAKIRQKTFFFKTSRKVRHAYVQVHIPGACSHRTTQCR